MQRNQIYQSNESSIESRIKLKYAQLAYKKCKLVHFHFVYVITTKF